MSKVQQMNAQQIQAILAAAQAQQVDLSSAEAIKAFTESLSAKPAVVAPVKEVKPKTLKEGQIACVARVWSKTGQKPGTGLDSCGKASVDGCDYCAVHKKKAEVTEIPAQKAEDGSWLGLYLGRIDQEIPYKNPAGEITIVWNNNPEIMAKINADKANGAVHCKFTNEAHFKKVPSVTRVRKAKATSEAAAPVAEAPVAVKGKKGKKTSKKSAKPSNIKGATNAFMYFSNEKRAEVKAKLLADFLAENPEADKKAITAATAVGKVAQAIGQLYKELSDEAKETYKQLEVADKLRYNAEMEAYKAQEALGAVVSEEAEEEPAEEQEEAEDSQEETPAQEESSIEATEIEINSVTYLYDSNTSQLYTLDCEPCGFLRDGKIVQE